MCIIDTILQAQDKGTRTSAVAELHLNPGLSDPRVRMLAACLAALQITTISPSLKKKIRDFSGDPVVKNPPYNAGDKGLIPGQGTKIPHATGQLSSHATTTELSRLN